MKPAQIAWLLGLVASVSSALIGQAELLGEPWRHVVTVISVITTAFSGYMLQRPNPWDGRERRQGAHRAANLRLDHVQAPPDLQG